MFNIAIISVLKEVRRCHSSNPVTKTTATPTQIKPPPSEGWILWVWIIKNQDYLLIGLRGERLLL